MVDFRGSFCIDFVLNTLPLKRPKIKKLRSPDAVLFPATTEEVSQIAKYCYANRIPMIPFGLGSGFEGGITSPHGDVSIDLRRMNQGNGHFRSVYDLDKGSADGEPLWTAQN